MRLAWTTVAGVLGFVGVAAAGPICAPGTLASYELLASAGCMIGPTTFANFNVPSGISGATAISPSAITITPQGGITGLALAFSMSSSAMNGQILEALINFSVSGTTFTSDAISSSGTSSAGNGAVTHIQNYCAGGSFDSTGVSNCSSGKTGDLVVLGNGADSTTLPAAALISVTEDITFDGGMAGSAAGGVFVASFFTTTAPVPEPRSLGLLGFLLLAGAYYCRNRINPF